MLESIEIFMPEIFVGITAWFSRLYKFGPRSFGVSGLFVVEFPTLCYEKSP